MKWTKAKYSDGSVVDMIEVGSELGSRKVTDLTNLIHATAQVRDKMNESGFLGILKKSEW